MRTSCLTFTVWVCLAWSLLLRDEENDAETFVEIFVVRHMSLRDNQGIVSLDCARTGEVTVTPRNSLMAINGAASEFVR